jgi:hypothetical protein
VTGGFRVYLLGVPLSVRGESRPALLAILLTLASLHLAGAWRSRTAAALLRGLPGTAPWIATIAAFALLIVGVGNASTVAGGSDASGYLSQASLWLKRDLTVAQPDVGAMPWPDSLWTFAPLGYRPEPAAGVLIPTYAPGLPLLMAAARQVAGICGPYFISPVCAALLVLGTYAFGVSISGRAVALIASLAVAVSPAVLFMTVQPMSDVPNAAFWTLSLVFARRGGRMSNPLIAGIAAGIAILIRPNLAPLAAFPALLVVTASDGRRPALVRTAWFAAGCAPFVAAVASIFNELYGSPLRSGYGSLAETYSFSNTAANMSAYPRWFLESQGLAAFAFLLAPLAAFAYRGRERITRLLSFAFVGAVFGCYVFYTSFEEWWYLRFLLAAFPFVFVLGGDAVSTAAARFGRLPRLAALVVFGAFVILIGVNESSARHVLEHGGERRYVDAGAYLQHNIAPGAVVITMQHSGSVAYYTDKLPLRYDWIAPEWIDRVVDHFHGGGRRVYLLLDDWEIPLVAARFRGQRAERLVAGQPVAQTMDGRVSLFATDPAEVRGSAVRMPRVAGCVAAAASNLYAR